MKLLLGLLLSISALAATTYTSQVHLSPVSAIVEQKVGASLTIATSGGSSLVGASLMEFKPVVWVTQTGSSVTSFAASPPSTGPGMTVYVSGDTATGGGALTLPMSFVFHAPSIYPAYGNSLQVGSQTYSVSGYARMSDGTVFFPTASTITVGPRPLPSSQVSGWH